MTWGVTWGVTWAGPCLVAEEGAVSHQKPRTDGQTSGPCPPAEQLWSGPLMGLASSCVPISRESLKAPVTVLRSFWKPYSTPGKQGSKTPGQMKASPEAPPTTPPLAPEHTGSLHACVLLLGKACRPAGAQKVLWSSLPSGACGQVQRRNRSEEAQDEGAGAHPDTRGPRVWWAQGRQVCRGHPGDTGPLEPQRPSWAEGRSQLGVGKMD